MDSSLSSTLAGPVDDLADEVTGVIGPYIRDLGNQVVDAGYDRVRSRFSADKDALADEVVEAARPRVQALVQELLADPELATKVGAAKAELEAAFKKSIMWTAILSSIGATVGVVAWMELRKR